MWNVLIADDDPFIRFDLKRRPVWERHGYRIAAEASDGAEAISQLSKNTVDLVFADIGMPAMDGMEFLEELRHAGMAVPVIMVSGSNRFDFVRRSMIWGASDYLLKPVEDAQLEEVLVRMTRQLASRESAPGSGLDSAHLTARELARSLSENPDGVPEMADQMLVAREAASDGDIIRYSLMLETIRDSFFQAVETSYPWIIRLHAWQQIIAPDHNAESNPRGQLHRTLESTAQLFRRLMPSSNDMLIRKTCEYVLQHPEEKMGLESIATALGFSSSHLGRVFRARTGEGVGDFVGRVRMEQAKSMLQHSGLKAYEVGERLGYRDAEHFCVVFKRHTGMTPSEFKNHRVG